MEFYLDYISPYAYLAWKEIGAIADKLDLTLEPKPLLFAATLNHHGQKGPAEIPSKKLHTFKHVTRLAKQLGHPLAPPPSHPFNPLLALRLTALDLAPIEKTKLIDTLFAGAWGGKGGVDKPEHVTKLLNDAGFEGSALVEQATTSENKQRLKEITAGAIERGVFGVPTIFVNDELLWGLDTLPHIEMIVNGDDPCDGDSWNEWLSVKPSASRI